MKKLFYILILISIFPVPGYTGLIMTRDDALNSAFPGNNTYEKIDIFLNDDQADRIEKIGRVKLDSKIYFFYKFTQGNETIGYAVLDTHLLRTKSETVMFVISPDGKLINTEILAFFEPADYMQSDKWLKIFKNKKLDSELRIDRNIPNITGATITSHAFTESARKVLAIFEVTIKEGTT